MDNAILAYYQQIKDGSILVGKWVLMLYEHIIHGIEEGIYLYDAKKADKAKMSAFFDGRFFFSCRRFML